MLDNVEYVWSIGFNSIINETLKYDPFEVMKNRGLAYASSERRLARFDECIMLWELVERSTTDQDLKMFAKNGFKIPLRTKRVFTSMYGYDTSFEFLHIPTFKKKVLRQRLTREIIDAKGNLPIIQRTRNF